MNSFLPDLMTALALVSRTEEFQLIQQPIAAFELKLIENLVSREFLQIRHSPRQFRSGHDGMEVIIQNYPSVDAQALLLTAIFE